MQAGVSNKQGHPVYRYIPRSDTEVTCRTETSLTQTMLADVKSVKSLMVKPTQWIACGTCTNITMINKRTYNVTALAALHALDLHNRSTHTVLRARG